MQTLYDFVFIDVDRVYSIYAQLFEGLHDAMENFVSNTTGKSHTGQLGNSFVGHASYSRKTDVCESSKNSFVPHDLILRDVLGRLVEMNMLAKEPQNAKCGNFVLLHGKLTLLDVGVISNFLELLPKLADEPKESDLVALPKALRKGVVYKQKENFKRGTLLVDFFTKMMPKAVQFSINDPRVTAWGTISQDKMRADVAHLFLQHGPSLSGDWHLLGIVDSEVGDNQNKSARLQPPFDGIFDLMSNVQHMFAKPKDDLLVTPLLLFRKICGPDENAPDSTGD